jgi:hypothetical protein
MTRSTTPCLIERPRRADAIARALDRHLDQAGFGPPGDDPLRAALVRIAARYGEIVTAGINAAPQRHLEAFADMLGGRPQPPVAARVYLVFKPAAGGAAATVPLHTRVAAAPAPGASEPVVFETQAELSLLRAEFVRCVLADAGHRAMTDLGAVLTPAGRADAWPAPGAQALVPAAYIAQAPAFGLPGLRQLILRIDLQRPAVFLPGSTLEWGILSADGFAPLTVERDTTRGLERQRRDRDPGPRRLAQGQGPGPRGAVAVRAPAPRRQRAADGGQRGGRARAAAADDQPSASSRRSTAWPLTQALNDGVPLDTSKDFQPLGERPRFGATWQLLSPAFADAGAQIELRIAMTNPPGRLDSPVPTVSRDHRPQLRWEISTAQGYAPLAVQDDTQSLTEDGSVMFTVPSAAVPVKVGVTTAACVRARLVFGDYEPGTTPSLPSQRSAQTQDDVLAQLKRALEKPAAPVLSSVQLRATLMRTDLRPEQVFTEAGLELRHVDPGDPAGFDLFPLGDVAGPTLYLALAGADTQAHVARVARLHVRPVPPRPPLVWVDGAQPQTPGPRWQFHAGTGWQDLQAQDGSAGLTRSGLITLHLPDMGARWPSSRLDPKAALLWLRACWPPGTDMARALPIGLGSNAVEATQTEFLRHEVLGSSTGRPDQLLHALRTPIVGEVDLRVRDADGRWQRWREVEDLAGSAPDDADFTLDRASGEIRFGNGRHGRIPPPGPSNLRLERYRTGGGQRGNVPALALTMLRTTIPGVDSVSNLEPAVGGLDASPAHGGRRAASAWLRHRERAVCSDDYADLALRASPEVACAYCFSGPDAAVLTAPDAVNAVVVMVLADDGSACPQPSLALLGTVKAYLDARRPPAARLTIIGPRYAAVAVGVRIGVRSGESAREVATQCQRRIEAFLHPLTGADGRGWGLTQRPHRSDLYAVLDTVEGVDLVRTLTLRIETPPVGPYVVCAGRISVTTDE